MVLHIRCTPITPSNTAYIGSSGIWNRTKAWMGRKMGGNTVYKRRILTVRPKAQRLRQTDRERERERKGDRANEFMTNRQRKEWKWKCWVWWDERCFCLGEGKMEEWRQRERRREFLTHVIQLCKRAEGGSGVSGCQWNGLIFIRDWQPRHLLHTR